MWKSDKLAFSPITDMTPVLNQSKSSSAYIPPSLRNRSTDQSTKLQPPVPRKNALSKQAREVLNLNRKLSQIKILKQRLVDGEELEANQLEKISKEDAIKRLLEEASK